MDTQMPSVVDEQMKLRAAGAITATANDTPIDMGTGFAPAMGGLPMQALIPVTVLKTSATDETYVVVVQDSPDNSTWTTRATKTITATGMVQLPFFLNAEYVRTGWTLGGTSPSITTLDSYITPQVLG